MPTAPPHPIHEFATVCKLISPTSYNTAGDTTTDGQRTYSYNSQQRIATTSLSPTTANPNPAKTNYLYNALGQRVFKTDPIFGTPTADNQKLGWAYIYDETGTLLGEYGMGGAASSGSTEHIYLPTAAGPLPVATVINGQHYAVHTDHLATPRRLTAANNQAVWQWAYSAFGQETATTAIKRFTSAHTVPQTGTTTTQPVAYHQRYPGQSFDVESGLHYNYFRTYDPQTGRYTQPDPIGLEGGWNRYSYVSGNPLGAVDPYGLLESFTFDLQGGRLSSDCQCMNGAVSAFSGNGPYANDPASSHIPFSGPIPPGKYFIVQPYVYTSNPRSPYVGMTFFKLFKDDGQLDDLTFVPDPVNPGESIQRSQFRFHPGTASDGCVTLRQKKDWLRIQHQLLNRTKIETLPNGMPYYGTINVK